MKTIKRIKTFPPPLTREKLPHNDSD
uniref:Uncharacterized protein n=1 Tax=Anguilla anguilla TaxID=7936 RepID=A0A0E9PHE3_ANGAN